VGADARAQLFRGETPDGPAYAVKTSTGPQPGLAVADVLARRGVPGVPGPVRTRDGSLAARHATHLLSVVPWVGDRRGLDHGLDLHQWHALGSLLGEVHRTEPGDSALVGLPPAGHDAGTLVSAARSLGGRIAAGDPADLHVRALAGLWADGGAERLRAVADLAEASGRDEPAWEDAPIVVCHADPHLGNVLLDDAGEVWLVDWDDAVLAAPECDLMFAVGGVLATPSAAEHQAFAQGYGSVEVHPTRLRFHQAARALHDFVDFAHDVLATDRLTGDHRAWALEVLAGQLSRDGLVAYALGERRDSQWPTG